MRRRTGRSRIPIDMDRWFAEYREAYVYRSLVSSRIDILFLPFCKSFEVAVAGIVIEMVIEIVSEMIRSKSCSKSNLNSNGTGQT